MFIVGLGLGAALAVVLGDMLLRSKYFSNVLAGVLLALMIVFCAFFTGFPAELRVGLVPGILLGTLLIITPERLSDAPEPEQLV